MAKLTVQCFGCNALLRRYPSELRYGRIFCSTRCKYAHPSPIIDRLMQHTVFITETGCWIWMGRINQDGYGKTQINGRRRFVHRVSYEIHFGPIPTGLELDHRCRVRCCWNPNHLEPVTHKVNMERGRFPKQSNKTHCPQGHPYSPENTYLYKNRRACRLCNPAKKKRYRERKRQAALSLKLDL